MSGVLGVVVFQRSTVFRESAGVITTRDRD